MVRTKVVVGLGLAVVAAGMGVSAGQLPLSSIKASGQTVTPAFEGWYRNPDGTFSLSFGYYSRNSEEIVEVPVGPSNFVAPGPENQGQPTEFHPRRHWGVFAVRVPADFGNREVVWTLKFRGATYAIPGRLHRHWEIDALEGEAGAGNTPPVLRFSPDGPEGRGPLGVAAGPVGASVGVALPLTVWARDDGRGGRGTPMITLAWFKHQGPGRVTFNPPAGRAAAAGGQVTTEATFAAPGEYVVRVRANDASGVANAGHAQCCWTNGFIRVTVKP